MDELAGPSIRPWQSNSLNSQLAFENSSNFAICIELTSIREPKDVRYLTLKPNKPCLIGRASKNKGEAHQSSSTNALFDCPVVSRQHAEIKVHLWSATGDQVTIVDNGSMHGTRVNSRKLEKGRSMALRNGDEIEFGDRVTRGDDTHDSVRVTYHRLSNESSNTLAPNAAAETTGYRGAYISDEEDEDFDPSGGDDFSDVSDDGYELDDPSSIQTTPEQAKGSIGSQANPIQLDPLKSSFIDLTDDEHVTSPSQPSITPAHHAEQLVQIELFDPTPSEGATASLPRVVDSNKMIEDSVKFVDELYRAPTGADQPQLINDMTNRATENKSMKSVSLENDDCVNDDFQPGQSEANVSDASQDYEIVSEHEESQDLDEGETELSEEDAADEDNAPGEDEDVSSLDEGDDCGLNRELSPELGSDTGFIDIPSTAPARLNTTTTSKSTVPSFPQRPLGRTTAPDFAPLQRPFDPIRSPGSPRPHVPLTSEYKDSLHSRLRPLQYFGPPADQSTPYDLSGPEPQHIPPPSLGTHGPFGPIPRDLQQGPLVQSWLPGGTISMPPPPPPRGYWPPPPPPYHGLSGFGHPPFPQYRPPPIHAVGGLPPPPPPVTIPSPCPQTRPSFNYNVAIKPKPSGGPKRTFDQQNEGEKDRISIGELVQDNEPTQEEVSKVSPAASGVKRKANEMSSSDYSSSFDINVATVHNQPQAVEEIAVAVNTTATDIAAAEKVLDEPAPRRRRVSAEDDVSTAVAVEAPEVVGVVQEVQPAAPAGTGIRSFAKYAGCTVLGGVATVAFLASPLAGVVDYVFDAVL